MSPIKARRISVLLSIILLAATGCNLPSQQVSSATVLNPVRWRIKEGTRATDFVMEGLNGEKIDSSRLRGHPILILFWASWCQPCREESRRIEAAARAYRSTGLVILAVTNETDRSEVARFAREQNLSYPILFDPGSVIFDQYRVLGIPTSYFVDASGIVRAVVDGPMSTADLDLNFAKILVLGASDEN